MSFGSIGTIPIRNTAELPQPLGQQEGAAMVGRAKSTSDAEARWKDPIHVVRELGCLGLLGMCLFWGGPRLLDINEKMDKQLERQNLILDSIAKSEFQQTADIVEIKNILKAKAD